MIIIYNPETGLIYQTINDPTPPGIEQVLAEQGRSYVSKPVIPLESIVVTDKVTGEPILNNEGQPIMAPKGYLEFSLHPDDYVDIQTRDVTRRPSMQDVLYCTKTTIKADSVDTCLIQDVPEGANVKINSNDMGPLTGGTLELQADTIGEYHIEFSLWPYLPASLVIVAE